MHSQSAYDSIAIHSEAMRIDLAMIHNDSRKYERPFMIGAAQNIRGRI